METHENKSHLQQKAFLEALAVKAAKMRQSGESTITGGKPDEQPLASWKSKANGMHCKHLPDDEFGIVRISIGGGQRTPVLLDYCVIRGSVGDCITLLEKAIAALREAP